MVVNSAFSRHIGSRLCARPLLLVLTIAIFLAASSFADETDRDIKSKQININIRQIGHRLLLQTGDSTSRVMPVTELKAGTFQLSFEHEFVFNHDSLIALSKTLLPKSLFPSGYIVTVNDCKTGGIVFGFQLNNKSPDLLACNGRSQPAGCYTIEFLFPGLYEKAKAGMEASDQLIDPLVSNIQEGNRTPAGSEPISNEKEVSAGNEKLKVIDPNSGDLNSKGEAPPGSTGYSWVTTLSVCLLVLLGISLLIRRSNKTTKEEFVSEQENHKSTTDLQLQSVNGDEIGVQQPVLSEPHVGESRAEVASGDDSDYPAIMEMPVAQLPAVGQFLFDVNAQQLLHGTEIITLTDKECKVLALLHKHFGSLISRETLLQEIWINEGVITGRSLDMFVSKLRKKLSGDNKLRITNIHGKGYKLEVIS